MRMERLLLRLLEQYEQQGLGQAMHELSVRHGDDVRIPYVVFFGNQARIEDGLLLDPPLLCVEILSPSQRLSELFAKCEVYHEWEVPYCWIIDPARKSAWEYHQRTPVRLLSAGETLAAGPPLAVSLAALFPRV